MFINTALVNTLNDALGYTQNGQTNKRGEQMLTELKQNSQFPTLLFDYYQNESNPAQLRLLAAVQFQHWFKDYKVERMNYIQQYIEIKIQYLVYLLEEYDYIVQQFSEVITTIKQQIISSYVSVYTNIGKQIEQAILYLAQKEFPHRWNNLTIELMSYIDFNLQNNVQTLKVLKILEKITDRYSNGIFSDELNTEIILVCNDCHDYLYKLTENVLQGIEQNHDTLNLVKILKFIMKIFHSLNYKDLHPKFEENLNNWMGLLYKTIKINVNPQVIGGNDITLFKAKGECLKAVLLYAMRYKEQFKDLIEHFAVEIWNMCTLTDQDPKFDKIVINALLYFKNLTTWQDLNHFFKQQMSQLMQSLIVPNIGVTPTEKIQFEDETTSFLESFFQFSDMSTRKSVTISLLKNFAKNFKTEIIEQIQNYLTQYKTQLDNSGTYDANTEIILLNLIIDGSTIAYSDKHGVTKISLPIELIEFVYEKIIKITLGQNPNILVEQRFNTLHICYYLRFFYYFRNYINRNEVLELTRIVSFFLRTQQESLYDLTSITIEGLLNLKEGDITRNNNVKNYFNKDNISPQIDEIILNLYKCSKAQDIIDSSILKTTQFIINLMKERSLEKIDIFINLITDQFGKLLKSGYDFQKASTLFECVSSLIDISSQNNQQISAQISNSIAPYFNKIINDNTSDLISFVLQTYSILIRNSSDISKNTYKIIFESLINPSNWIQDNVSVFPAYIIYIQSYISRVPNIIVNSSSQLQAILLQFLKLKQDLLFFEFIRIFITQFKLDELRQSGWLQFLISTCINFYSELVKEASKITNKSKGSKPIFVKNFIVFISNLINQYSAQQILNDFNDIQPDMLVNILLQELNLIKNISNYKEKKIIFVALIDLLFNNTSSINLDAFSNILNAIVQNMGTRRYKPAIYNEQNNSFQSMGYSGFYKISCLREKIYNLHYKLLESYQILIQILNKHQQYKIIYNVLIPDIQNIEKFFGQQFSTFYNNPQINNQLDMSQILYKDNQETLSKIILSGQTN